MREKQVRFLTGAARKRLLTHVLSRLMHTKALIQVVHQYHEATKHLPHRHARSLGYLDWATQPDPFRRYRDAPTVPLLFSEAADVPAYDALYDSRRIAPQPLCLESVSQFFMYSLALSAWKELPGVRWALRINPSSGNLHPTEAYLLMGPVKKLAKTPGLFHYAPKDHLLERRCEIQPDVWDALMDGLPSESFLIGLSSIHWREAWKYGERAYRYCQHDVGHALAALSLAAVLLGWRVRPLVTTSDAQLSTLLGFDRSQDFEPGEQEHPDLLIAVMPAAMSKIHSPTWSPKRVTIESIGRGTWFGTANGLSSDHVTWDIIDAVASACHKPPTPPPANAIPTAEWGDPLDPRRPDIPARRIIRQRRSAVAMDGHTSIPTDQFYLMMDRILPRFDRPPWCALGPPAYVHLALFVHRVEGLVPGLYLVVRDPSRLQDLRESMRPEFEWRTPTGCPPCLPVYRLMQGDVRLPARQLSCGQDIAADGAFSVAMIAAFDEPLRIHGAWFYRRLFWETGVIGQVLYLEAEAAGIRGTGIGCFFDDPVHQLFGFTGLRYQSLYHFTIGGPVEDTRLTTLPPYPPGMTRRNAGQADRAP